MKCRISSERRSWSKFLSVLNGIVRKAGKGKVCEVIGCGSSGHCMMAWYGTMIHMHPNYKTLVTDMSFTMYHFKLYSVFYYFTELFFVLLI